MSEMSVEVDDPDPLTEFAEFDEEDIIRALNSESREVVLIEDESFANFDEAEVMAALHQSVEPEELANMSGMSVEPGESANMSGMQLLRRI